MQHPTLQNVRIRSTRDALQVFHGVATHRLPLITRRLDAEERRNIVPGNVYVWSVFESTDMHRMMEILISGPSGRNVEQIQSPQGSVWSAGGLNFYDWRVFKLIALLLGLMGWDGVLVVCIIHILFYSDWNLSHQWIPLPLYQAFETCVNHCITRLLSK